MDRVEEKEISVTGILKTRDKQKNLTYNLRYNKDLLKLDNLCKLFNYDSTTWIPSKNISSNYEKAQIFGEIYVNSDNFEYLYLHNEILYEITILKCFKLNSTCNKKHLMK